MDLRQSTLLMVLISASSNRERKSANMGRISSSLGRVAQERTILGMRFSFHNRFIISGTVFFFSTLSVSISVSFWSSVCRFPEEKDIPKPRPPPSGESGESGEAHNGISKVIVGSSQNVIQSEASLKANI